MRIMGVMRFGPRRALRPWLVVSSLFLGAWLGLAGPARAALNILACEPEWAALASELGGSLVQVGSATTAQQDPHRVEARPSLLARARQADLLVCTGLELEAGWLPLLVRNSGNAAIVPGQAGYLEVGPLVPRLDIPQRVDRSHGDVHAQGNPHIHLNPRHVLQIAPVLAQRLARLDPANAAVYAERQQDFSRRWAAAIQRWEAQAAPLKGLRLVEHHASLSYLSQWLGLQVVATLEPKPGVEPSIAHLSGLLAQLQQQPARLVARTPYQDARPADWLAERARVPVVVVPYTVGGSPAATDLFGLFDDTVARLLRAQAGGAQPR